MFRRTVLALVTVMFALQGGLPSASADAGTVRLVDVDGGVVTGTLESLSETTVTVTDGRARSIATDDLVELRIPERSPLRRPDASMIVLENGDRIAARPTQIDEIRLLAQWVRFPSWKPVSIPLETIRAAIFKAPLNREVRTRLLRLLRDRDQPQDELILKNGDRVAGELAAMTEQAVTLTTAVGEVSVPAGRVRALAMNPELISFPATSGRRVLLTLIDGSRVTVRSPSLTSTGLLACRPAFGGELELPLSSIVSMRFLGGRTVYLSELEAVEYEFTPYLTRRRKPRMDRNVAGGPLQLRGVEYPLGVGLHSACRITYDLSGDYRDFRATIGVDDAADGQGSAVFAVLVDGERAHVSKPLTGRSPARRLEPVDVRGAQRLTLIVEFGPFGDIGDYADWCNARLVKSR